MIVTGIEALRQAERILKSLSGIARAVGRTPQAVSERMRKGGDIPAEWCIPLEAATAAAGEKISRGQFRPDLWPEDFARISTGARPPVHRERDADIHAPKRAGAGAR